jgi:hypothetical protein
MVSVGRGEEGLWGEGRVRGGGVAFIEATPRAWLERPFRALGMGAG